MSIFYIQGPETIVYIVERPRDTKVSKLNQETWISTHRIISN